MTLTTQRYIPDSGKITVNTLDAGGSIVTVSPSAPRRTTRTVYSLGGQATEAQTFAKAGNYEIALEGFDDKSLNNEVTGILGILWNAYYTNTALSVLKIVPAGSTLGMSEYTYGTVEVVQCPPHANMDSDTENEGTFQAVITCESVTAAALT